MKNKTLSNWFIASWVACIIGAVSVSGLDTLFFTIGGLGLIVFTIFSVIRLYKIDPKHWLSYALGITTLIYLLVVFSNSLDTLIGQLSVIAFWVFGIMMIVRLRRQADLIS